MKLWFENSDGICKVVKDPCNTWEEVNAAIDEFIARSNRNCPNKTPFKRYYTRMWREDNAWVFDVGSWSEFFYWDSDKTIDDLDKEEGRK